LAGRAVRPRLPDQLPALHLLRPVHRGVPDPRADDDQRVRARRSHAPRDDLREAGPARATRRGDAGRAAPDGAGHRGRRLLPWRGDRPGAGADRVGRAAPARRPVARGAPRARGRPGREGKGPMTTLLASAGAALPVLTSLAETGRTSTGEEVLFWCLAPVMVIAALGLVFARRTVYAAMSVVLVMICLAVLYVAQEAPFL